jgi:hypothetical protein
MKKETLEEAAERYADKIWDFSNSNEKTLHANCNKAFLKGAKWQQERSYSEEEVLEIIRQYALEEHLITSSKPDIWFEQFKKK